MTYSTYTRIGDYAVEFIGEEPDFRDYDQGIDYHNSMVMWQEALQNQRKIILSDELKQQWPEGETRRRNEFTAWSAMNSITGEISSRANPLPVAKDIYTKDINKLLKIFAEVLRCCAVFKENMLEEYVTLEEHINAFKAGRNALNEFKQKYPHL